MINRTILIDISAIADLPQEYTVLLCTRSVRDIVNRYFNFKIVDSFDAINIEATRNLVVVGGGKLIDEAKIFMAAHGLQLYVIPSLWGSGAENSPVVVWTDDGQKIAKIEHGYFPNFRGIIAEFASKSPQQLRKWGAGDCLSHLIEGLLSPLSKDEGIANMQAKMISSIIFEPVNLNDCAWFERSAQACWLQSQTGVGLIHSIAHTLEPKLEGVNFKGYAFGHARLCSTFIFPVMRFALEYSEKVRNRFSEFGIDHKRLEDFSKFFHDKDDYEFLLPYLELYWELIIRHPFSRANYFLIRKAHLEMLKEAARV